MRHNYCAMYKNVLLRPLEEGDIENLRIWRNDRSKTQYLRQIGEITPEMQKKWFREYLEKSEDIIFAIVETGELNRMVGSVALYDFKEKEAEVGKIQIGDVEANGRGLGSVSLVMAMWLGFKKMGLEKIVGAVHQDNIAAHKMDMKIGFQIVGTHEASMGGIEDEIELDEKRLLEVNQYAKMIRIL